MDLVHVPYSIGDRTTEGASESGAGEDKSHTYASFISVITEGKIVDQTRL